MYPVYIVQHGSTRSDEDVGPISSTIMATETLDAISERSQQWRLLTIDSKTCDILYEVLDMVHSEENSTRSADANSMHDPNGVAMSCFMWNTCRWKQKATL